MSFRYLDLSGGGRHLSVTSMAQVLPNVAGLNTMGAAALTTQTPTQPGIFYTDTTGFFAPTWGSGDEALSFVVAVNHQTSTGNMFFSWTNPANPGYYSMYFYTNALKLYLNYGNQAATGMYLSAETQFAQAAGVCLIHGEIRTGATREVNLWWNNVMPNLIRGGPTGSPFVPSGNEIVQVLSRPDGIGSNNNAVGLIGFAKRRFTAAERFAHLQAFNAA